MSTATAIFSQSLGRKLVMAITGLFLISFLLVHMTGNLQLFTKNALSFNEYTRFMTTSPIIKASEFILVAGFFFHIIFAVRLTRQNNAARPVKYAYTGAKKEADSTWMSRNMGITGSIILIFLITHLAMFWREYKFGAGETVSVEQAFNENWKLTQGVTAGATVLGKGAYLTKEDVQALKSTNIQQVQAVSMYKVTVDAFKQWWISLFYIAAMILLGLHLNHGFQSAFRTLGLEHKKYTPLIEKLGLGYCILVPGLFAAMPIFLMIFG